MVSGVPSSQPVGMAPQLVAASQLLGHSAQTTQSKNAKYADDADGYVFTHWVKHACVVHAFAQSMKSCASGSFTNASASVMQPFIAAQLTQSSHAIESMVSGTPVSQSSMPLEELPVALVVTVLAVALTLVLAFVDVTLVLAFVDVTLVLASLVLALLELASLVLPLFDPDPLFDEETDAPSPPTPPSPPSPPLSPQPTATKTPRAPTERMCRIIGAQCVAPVAHAVQAPRHSTQIVPNIPIEAWNAQKYGTSPASSRTNVASVPELCGVMGLAGSTTPWPSTISPPRRGCI